MDMSLDDIIRSKKGTQAPSKKFGVKRPITQPLRKTLNKPVFRETRRITDARLKIIQKNRAKIRDARDKLAEITRSNGDVRKKLMQKQDLTTYKYGKMGSGSVGSISSSGSGLRRTVSGSGGSGKHLTVGGLKTNKTSNYKTSSLPTAPSRRRENHFEIPRGYVDYDNMEKMEEEEYAAASRLSRTVQNDMAYEMAPPAPRRLNSWGSSSTDHFDPFDVYEVPYSTRHERRMSPDLPAPPVKGILRSSSLRERSPDAYARRYIPEQTSHLSYEMQSRLERAPDPHASMGIFSNPLKNSSMSSSMGGAASMPISSSGYRIVVSNLHTSVTQSDIKELFEDIGELYDSRIVRPGVAEVIYKSLNDAEKAVDTYHNRQLDGQPMKCLLVNPRASNKPTAPAMRSSSLHSSNKTPLEIDIDALHKVLFRRH